MKRAVLLVSCPDRKGIVKEIASFIANNNGNIVHFDQHIDPNKEMFFARVEWDLKGFKLSEESIKEEFSSVAEKFSMNFSIHFTDYLQKVAIFVSKQGHCLYDLLQRFKSGELNGRVELVISNHEDLRSVAEFFGVPYHHIPKHSSNKEFAEKKELELLKEKRIDLIVLARYMQILSKDFVSKYENKIINIHHSFLPAFPGAAPYRRAYERGVKILGATSHYVTETLDEGPIIEQDIIRVSHRDTLEDFIQKGKDIERIVLARAVRWHLEYKVLVCENKTVVFS